MSDNKEIIDVTSHDHDGYRQYAQIIARAIVEEDSTDPAFLRGQLHTLDYLIGIARDKEPVWAALFCEIRMAVFRKLEAATK